jgi:hypothetical protein
MESPILNIHFFKLRLSKWIFKMMKAMISLHDQLDNLKRAFGQRVTRRRIH